MSGSGINIPTLTFVRVTFKKKNALTSVRAFPVMAIR